MAGSSLVLPGVLYVGEDERARVVAHTGPAAGWHVPRGILGWSTEVSFVGRDALTEEIRRSTKLVMPGEQIPPAKMPLTSQAAQKSPLVAVSSRLIPKLVEAGVRVHTVGVDRVTSSFYYLAEGAGEEQIRVEGDLVQAVGSMLGERADNAAIERVLDGLPDRLLRSLSKDRVSELTVELAALLPRAAADGTGMVEIDLDTFEKNLAALLSDAEKYAKVAQEIADKLAETNERRVEVPLFSEARKVSQGPFDIAVGERRVALPTYERWVMSSGLGETAGRPVAASAPEARPGPKKHDSQDSMLANLESGGGASEAAARAAEEARKAAAAAEEKRKADEARAAQARAREAEEKRKADEARAAAAEEKRKADEARAAQARAREAEEKRKADEARAEAEAAEQKRKAAEEAKQAEEAAAERERRAAHEAKLAEEAKVAEAQAADEKRKADELAAEAKKVADEAAAAEEKRKAEEKRRFDEKKAETRSKKEAKRADSKRPPATDDKPAKAKGSAAIQPAAKGSNTPYYIAFVILVAAGIAVWKFVLKH